jgi:hypothetical protein
MNTNFMGYQPGDEPQTVVRTFRELSKIEFPDRPIIRGLLDELELLLLYGGSNLGKSILSLITAMHLANGKGRLFGTWEIERAHRVLFVQAENSSKSIQRRVQTMLSARAEWAEAAFDNIGELAVPDRGEQPRGKVTHRDFQAEIIEGLTSFGADFWVLDPLSRYHTCNENSNDEMTQVMSAISDINREAGAACMVVHHIGKGGSTPRGAQAIYDCSDSILSLEEAGYRPGEDRKTLLPLSQLTLEKSRNARKGTTAFIRMDQNLIFDEAPDGPTMARAEKLEVVRATLMRLGGVVPSQKALIEALRQGPGKFGLTTAKNLIAEAIGQGMIEAFTEAGARTKSLRVKSGQVA